MITMPLNDVTNILSELESSIKKLRVLRSEIERALPASPAPQASWPPAVVVDLQSQILARSLSGYRGLLAPEAVLVDHALGRRIPLEMVMASSGGESSASLDRFDEEILNQIANETYLVYEKLITAHVRVAAPGNRSMSKASIETATVDILTVDAAGQISSIDSYYDSAGIARQVGQLPDIPMGHDSNPVTPHVEQDALTAIRRSHRMVRCAESSTAAAERNRQNCQRIHDAFQDRTPERFKKLIAEDAVWIDMPTRVVLNGQEAALAHDYSNWARAFPRATARVENLIANDRWCVVQHVGEGLHEGELVLGHIKIPPTGKMVSVRVCDVVGYGADGRAVIIRNYYDVGLMLSQLGLLSKLASAVPGGHVTTFRGFPTHI